MKIAISSGHAKYVRGASGYPVPPQLDEVDEARKVVETVAQDLRAGGIECVTFHDDTSHSQSENLNRIVNWHNQQTRDYDCSIHFNAFDGHAHGVEVLYVTQSSLASKMSSAIAAAGGFTNRGGKYRSDLAFLNGTHEPAVLVETCFCDNTGDSEKYNDKFDEICQAIAESLVGRDLPDQPGEQPPEPEQPPAAQDNRVEVTSVIDGDVSIHVNDVLVHGHEDCEHHVDLKIKLVGDVVLVVNGEEFHNDTAPPAETGELTSNHCDVEATVFGGAGDPNYSAYPPYDAAGNGRYLDDTELYVALPYSFDPSEPLPKVRVYHGELSAVGIVADKGPWTTDDDAYVNGPARPIAETCHDEGVPLPSGPNKGKVPSNRAGIDLSPALARMLAIDGKGQVDWEFER